ncbi:MAG: ComEC/Rec2 family competence protein [Oscillospiraceae bacterium]|nr:ComEC/Rec2 family competence protein [Oscillospiraceae bacterium]
MKRVLFCAGISVACFIGFSCLLTIRTVLLICSLLTLATLVLFLLSSRIKIAKYYAIILFCVSLFGGFYLLYYNHNISPVLTLAGNTAEIYGQVVEEPEQFEAYKVYYVKTEQIGLKGAPQAVKLRLMADVKDEINAFDMVTATVEFNELSDQYKFSNYSNKVYIGASTYILTLDNVPQNKPLYNIAVNLRIAIREKIKKSFDSETAGIMRGLILGDTDGISNELYSWFKTCGVIHIFSVSGLHLAVFCSVIMTLLNKLRVRRRISAGLTILVVLGVMAITGFSPPVVRSGITYIIMLVGIIVFRKSDPLNSLGAAILIMLLVNPFYICSLSFLLSCSSMLGIIVIAPKFYDAVMGHIKLSGMFHKIAGGFVLVFTQSVAASLATLPFIAAFFGWISIISPVANLAIETATMAAMVICLIGLALSCIPFLGVVANLFSFCCSVFIRYTIICAKYLSSLPFAKAQVGYNWFLIWNAAVLLLLGVALVICKDRIRLKFVAILSVFMLLSSIASSCIVNVNITEIAVINDASGYSVVLNRGNEAVIIGCSNSKSIVKKLNDYYGSRGLNCTKAVFVPTYQENCAGGAVDVVESFPSENILMPSQTYTSFDVLSPYDYISVSKPIEHSTTKIWDDVEITAISQNYGCFIKVNIGGIVALLTTSYMDLSKLQLDFTIDIIITSTAICDNIPNTDSTVAVVTGDAAKYDFVCSKLNNQGITNYFNGENTATVIRTKGDGLYKIIAERLTKVGV